MNRLIRTILVNNKSILQLAVKKSLFTATNFKKFELIRPITSATTLFNINRTFGSFEQNGRRPMKRLIDDLVEEENTEEVSCSPRVPKSGDAKKYSEGQASFDDYKLPVELSNKLKELGYDAPFPIQSATLPHTLSGKLVQFFFKKFIYQNKNNCNFFFIEISLEEQLPEAVKHLHLQFQLYQKFY